VNGGTAKTSFHPKKKGNRQGKSPTTQKSMASKKKKEPGGEAENKTQQNYINKQLVRGQGKGNEPRKRGRGRGGGRRKKKTKQPGGKNATESKKYNVSKGGRIKRILKKNRMYT